jgi:hypothetical protein
VFTSACSLPDRSTTAIYAAEHADQPIDELPNAPNSGTIDVKTQPSLQQVELPLLVRFTSRLSTAA